MPAETRSPLRAAPESGPAYEVAARFARRTAAWSPSGRGQRLGPRSAASEVRLASPAAVRPLPAEADSRAKRERTARLAYRATLNRAHTVCSRAARVVTPDSLR